MSFIAIIFEMLSASFDYKSGFIFDEYALFVSLLCE